MPARYEVEVLTVEPCGVDVWICRFARPEGYSFRAGQWFRLTLTTPNGELTETFSHCAAPSDDAIEMVTRLTGSPFKISLAGLKRGDHVGISAPGGRLAVPPEVDRICMLAGGIGITPVRSLLRDAHHAQRAFTDALLIYANRDESCVPFADEFQAMADIGVRMVQCFEHPSASWEGERGLITADLVRRHVDPSDGRIFLAAGPPPMVAAMERVLDRLGVPDELRLLEHFGAPVT